MGEGWTLLTFRGIPLRIQPSWLFALAIFTILFQGRYALSSRQPSLDGELGLGWRQRCCCFYRCCCMNSVMP